MILFITLVSILQAGWPASVSEHDGTITAVAFSPSGALVASAGIDQVGILSDSQSRRTLAILRGHHGPVTSLAFHPTEAILATASWDHTARIWNVRNNREVAICHVSPESVETI